MSILHSFPLRLLAAAAFTLTVLVSDAARAAEPAAVARAYNMERGEEVTVEGTVHDFRGSNRPNVPNSFTLKDESGTIPVAIWPNVFDEIPGRERLTHGARVKVTGKVAEFRGKTEIHVHSASDVELPAAPAGAAPDITATGPGGGPPIVNPGVTPIAGLTRERQNQIFTISGKLNSARRPSSERAPYILRVSDPTGEIDVVFWEDLASQLPESKQVEPGDRLQVTGRLGEHRGNLQLRLDGPSDLKTPKSDPEAFRNADSGSGATTTTPRAAAEMVPPDAVAALPVGMRVSVAGRVTGIEPVRLGRKVRLQGETTTGSEAVLLLWDTASGLKPEVHYLKTSSTLTVAGTVAEARGEKVVVVSDPEDVLAVTVTP